MEAALLQVLRQVLEAKTQFRECVASLEEVFLQEVEPTAPDAVDAMHCALLAYDEVRLCPYFLINI